MRLTTTFLGTLLFAASTFAEPQLTSSTLEISGDVAAANTTSAKVTSSTSSRSTAVRATNRPIPFGASITVNNGTATNSTNSTGNAGSSLVSTNGTAGNSTGPARVWVVKVGDPTGKKPLAFVPDTIRAKAGDMIQFQFFARNHSVVSGSFEAPCVPQRDASPDASNAFFSGFMPTNATTSGQLVYTIEVKDTSPQWFYCSQARHCQDGMVGVINPPKRSNQTLAAFVARAAKAPRNITPGSQGNSNAVVSNSTLTTPSSVDNYTSAVIAPISTQTSTSTSNTGVVRNNSASGGLVASTAVVISALAFGFAFLL